MIPTHIVDDVASDRYIARRRLMKSGAFSPLEESSDGSEFLRKFFDSSATTGNGPPELILMDINMPELDGFETIAELKRRSGAADPRLVVALFSSSDNERDLERSAASGLVEHFFTKPINDSAIETILATYRKHGFI